MSEIQTDGIIRDPNPGEWVAEPLSNTNDDLSDIPYISPTPGEIPIIAQAPIPQSFHSIFSSVPEERLQQTKDYQQHFRTIATSLRDSGFNATLYGDAFELMDAMTDASANAGVNVILNPVWLHDSPDHTKAVLDHYKGKAQPVAWQIFDQPKFYDWGNLMAETAPDNLIPEDQACNTLSVALNMVRDLDSSKMAFFNLAAPEIKQGEVNPVEWIGSCDRYEGYLTALDGLYTPPLWSYDLYPFIITPGTVVTSTHPADVRYDHFYRYLGCFGKISAITRRPFWAYCMCQGHSYWEKDSDTGVLTKRWIQPVPTAGMLRFEAFNALAFGAQGIVYWCYGQQRNASPNAEGLRFDRGPLDFSVKGEGVDRTITPVKGNVWNAVKQVNSEIRNFSNIFLGCTFVSAGQVGKAYGGLPLISGAVAGVKVVSTGKEGVLVTRIDNNGYEYVVIVNHDPFNKQEVICILYKGREYIVSMPGQADQDCSPGNTTSFFLRRTLKEGGYLIIRTKEIS